MKILSKKRILKFMNQRQDALYDQVVRDFGGQLADRYWKWCETKYWKEAIERGEFDVEEMGEVYIILSRTKPKIVDFSFYTDVEFVAARVNEFNRLVEKDEYYYITLYENSRNLEKGEETVGKA